MEDLNALINGALKTEREDYLSPAGIQKFFNAFEKLAKDDKCALKILMYFFPGCLLQKNNEQFWFIKYKADKGYNEYEFAKDLLMFFIQYRKDGDKKSFETKAMEKVKLFGNSKFIGTFLKVLEKYDDKLDAIISYIAKDASYFIGAFELVVSPDNIQKISSIKEINYYLEKKKLLLELERGLKMIKIYSEELKEVQKSNAQIKKDNAELRQNYADLQKCYVDLQKDNVNLKKDNFDLANKVEVQNNRLVQNESKFKAMDEKILSMESKIKENSEKIQKLEIRLEKI